MLSRKSFRSRYDISPTASSSLIYSFRRVPAGSLEPFLAARLNSPFPFSGRTALTVRFCSLLVVRDVATRVTNFLDFVSRPLYHTDRESCTSLVVPLIGQFSSYVYRSGTCVKDGRGNFFAFPFYSQLRLRITRVTDFVSLFSRR